MRNMAFVGVLALMAPLFVTPAQSQEINHAVAEAYNNGVVRCSNADCAEYLYGCFRAYSGASLEEFLACGSLASRLNNNQRVVGVAS